MRPIHLTPLFSDLKQLDGVGPKLVQLFAKLIGKNLENETVHVIDVLWHMPTGLIDRRNRLKISELVGGQIASLEVTVLSHKAPPGRRSRIPYRVQSEDDTGRLDLVFFRGDKKYLEQQLPIGAKRFISGRVENYAGKYQMPHPDFILKPEEIESFPFLEPVYPLTQGLTSKTLLRTITQALKRLPQLSEWQDNKWINKNKWPEFVDALQLIHKPQQEADISLSGPARQRLAYDELLAMQLTLALLRREVRHQRGLVIEGAGQIRDQLQKHLPFTLTNSQQQTLQEIYDDMSTPHRMLRLLQGDVGSGKTIVALFAAANAIEAGYQAALMAPTEVLARQHYASLQELTSTAGINMSLLTGRETGKERKQIYLALKEGLIDLLIGTHALFQPGVEFKNLGLAVIDEQHRFGVHQRLALQSKGGKDEGNTLGADILAMTATPIPRTLLMTHYGDMDVSRLTEKPAGRKPIATRAMPIERLEELLEGLKRALQSGRQIYWVCPLVEGSDKITLAAAEERHAHLSQYFGTEIGLVHGQMAGPDKDKVMSDFSTGAIPLLVATTVIEVGVNVPNASIMVIEHAERFGLSQLHQLRGRVGRGATQSSCILLYYPPLGSTAKERLRVMRETQDGFVISEEDLRLRGGGELLGTRQSGLPDFKLANVPDFNELILAAKDDVKLILNQDPELKSERGQALRDLLYLFECDEAMKIFRAG